MNRSQNAVSLPGVPDRLRLLSKRLGEDPHIRVQIEGIADQAVQCAGTFSQSLKENTHRLYIQGELLKQTRKPKDVKVGALQNALTDTKASFKTSHFQIIQLQTKVHVQIETCREQVKTHREDQTRKKQRIDKNERDIKDLKNSIDNMEEEARDLDATARNLNSRASDLEEASREKAKNGLIGGIVSFAVGIVLVPFTGGASFFVGSAAAGITMGVNLHDSIDCKKRADDCSESAKQKRQKAREFRDKVTEMKDEIKKLRTDVDILTQRIAVLEDAMKALHDVTSFLASSIAVSDEVVEAIQEMDTIVTETKLSGAGFLSTLRAKKESVAERQMQRLKDSWDRLQQVMARNRTYALEN